jgi:hypothetical protein
MTANYVQWRAVKTLSASQVRYVMYMDVQSIYNASCKETPKQTNGYVIIILTRKICQIKRVWPDQMYHFASLQ